MEITSFESKKVLKRLNPTDEKETQVTQLISRIKNNGNVSVDTEVKVKVYDSFNTLVQENVNTFPVLRGDKLEVRYDFLPSEFGGYFKANLEVSYDANVNNVLGEKADAQTIRLSSDTITFYETPKQNIIAFSVLVIVAVVTILAIVGVVLYKRYQIRKTWKKYKIKKGEELPDIVQAHGVKWQDIASANGLRPPYYLNEGESLYIPPKKKTTNK